MFLLNYPSIILLLLLSIIIIYIIIINQKNTPVAILPKKLKITVKSDIVELKHESDVIIDCECKFDNIECKNLIITKNGKLNSFNVTAENLLVEGELVGASMVSVRNRVKVKGKLTVDILSAKEVILCKKSEATVTTVRKETKIFVKSGAFIKGFFQDIDEMVESVQNYCRKSAPDILEEDENSIMIRKYHNVKKLSFKKRDDDETLL